MKRNKKRKIFARLVCTAWAGRVDAESSLWSSLVAINYEGNFRSIQFWTMKKLWKAQTSSRWLQHHRDVAANKRAAQDVTIIRLIYIITHHTNFKLRTLHNFIFIEKRLANWARLLYKAKRRICFHNEAESRSRRIMEKLSRKRRENFNPKVCCLTSSPPRQKAWISRRS